MNKRGAWTRWGAGAGAGNPKQGPGSMGKRLASMKKGWGVQTRAGEPETRGQQAQTSLREHK